LISTIPQGHRAAENAEDVTIYLSPPRWCEISNSRKNCHTLGHLAYNGGMAIQTPLADITNASLFIRLNQDGAQREIAWTEFHNFIRR
jgi:hypothetical protein